MFLKAQIQLFAIPSHFTVCNEIESAKIRKGKKKELQLHNSPFDFSYIVGPQVHRIIQHRTIQSYNNHTIRYIHSIHSIHSITLHYSIVSENALLLPHSPTSVTSFLPPHFQVPQLFSSTLHTHNIHTHIHTHTHTHTHTYTSTSTSTFTYTHTQQPSPRFFFFQQQQQQQQQQRTLFNHPQLNTPFENSSFQYDPIR
ncbi:hypothetical protein EYC84_009798 [Monilinia fructicola]|uniref:Uncharacterized protein n=1 Tax=Monilinia fructicola TaxID=38448 RepID=A0A5M9JB51_MONFR|nr:hypothetical protein EYC84_009798 [Monilinia fructicola]